MVGPLDDKAEARTLMQRIDRCLLSAWLALAGLGLATAPAGAADPKWEYGKVDDTKGKRVFKATFQTGVVLNSGNANNLALNGAGSFSVTDGKNKGQLDVAGSYARATTIAGVDGNANGVIDRGEIVRTTSVSSALWGVKLRYDRSLTVNNQLFIASVATGNQPAGIVVAAGGQAGYSRQFVKTDMHAVVAETGYDFTFQKNVTGIDLAVHSLRLFASYGLTPIKDVSITVALEVLCNLNPLPGYTPGTTVDPFRHTRLNANAALNAKLWKNFAFQLSFLARYNTNPAPLPAFAIPYAAGYIPRAEPLDTLTSISLVITVL